MPLYVTIEYKAEFNSINETKNVEFILYISRFSVNAEIINYLLFRKLLELSEILISYEESNNNISFDSI